jgi:O-antigen/teichoic acid export membrane protein
MEIQQDRKEYQKVFHTTFIFGGMQVFNILVGLVRNKMVAVLLGASGLGFMGLLNSPLGFISLLTGLGISFSAIRDISVAHETGDRIKLSSTLKTFRRWVWFTGLLGMLAVIALSPWLSQWSFGNKNYVWAYLLISITLLVKAINDGQSAALRGTRRIKDTAKAGALGSVFGLIISIPLYYFYRINGIVPAVILSSFVGLFLSWYFSRKIKTIPVQLSYKESYTAGKAMVKLGLAQTVNVLIGNGITYLLIAFISNRGGMSDVGLYNAGWSITNQYVGLVFTAMVVDFYPRLSGVHTNNLKVNEMINQQAEIAILMIAPIMLLYLSSLPLLVPILYTKKFLLIIPFTQWVVLGMLLKTASWPMSYIPLAKGDSKFYFFLEGIFNNGLQLIAFIVCYYFFGLEGIGIAFFIIYILYFALIVFIGKKRYHVSYTKTFIKMFIFQLLLCTVAFLIAYFFKYPIGYISGGILLIVSSLYSYKELNKRIDLKDFVMSKIRRK